MKTRITPIQWLICVMAAIGFAFDIYVLLVLPLILPPALAELLPNTAPGSDTFNNWRGLIIGRFVPSLMHVSHAETPLRTAPFPLGKRRG